jgi:hypothetical protein
VGLTGLSDWFGLVLGLAFVAGGLLLLANQLALAGKLRWAAPARE